MAGTDPHARSTLPPSLALCALVACGPSTLPGTGSGTEGTTSDSSGQQSAGTSGSTSVGATSETAGTATSQTTDRVTTSSGASTDDTEGRPEPDVGSGETEGTEACGCPHPYIWVANSGENTVSKINTTTLEEEGRYLTRADGDGNPSRTSVNLAGDVVVANRFSGLTKFWADERNCEDRNGNGTIQTSTGADDVLPWAQEECRAWSTSFDTTNQRPVAWTAGERPDSCDASTAKVWTVHSAEPGMSPGLGGAGGVVVSLLNGETGVVEETLSIPEFGGDQLGAYGGAVDGEGNFWFSQFALVGEAQVARIDLGTLEHELFTAPPGMTPYGITVDHLGRPWVAGIQAAGAARLDPATGTWVTTNGFSGGTGITEGPDGLMMYVANGTGVVAVDIETLAVGAVWPNSLLVKGVGFDADGYLWAVAAYDADAREDESPAYKIDVDTMTTIDSYDGLTEPYTYSDLTGSALRNFSCLDRR